MADIIFPKEESQGIELFSQGGETILHSLDIYTLKPASFTGIETLHSEDQADLKSLVIDTNHILESTTGVYDSGSVRQQRNSVEHAHVQLFRSKVWIVCRGRVGTVQKYKVVYRPVICGLHDVGCAMTIRAN